MRPLRADDFRPRLLICCTGPAPVRTEEPFNSNVQILRIEGNGGPCPDSTTSTPRQGAPMRIAACALPFVYCELLNKFGDETGEVMIIDSRQWLLCIFPRSAFTQMRAWARRKRGGGAPNVQLPPGLIQLFGNISSDSEEPSPTAPRVRRVRKGTLADIFGRPKPPARKEEPPCPPPAASPPPATSKSSPPTSAPKPPSSSP